MIIIKNNLDLQYDIIYSKEYIDELTLLYQYIAIHLNEENVAKKLITRIKSEIINLRYFPKRNKLISKNKKEKLYRCIVKKKYVIIYKVDEKLKKTYILHFFNSKQNYLKFI